MFLHTIGPDILRLLILLSHSEGLINSTGSVHFQSTAIWLVCTKSKLKGNHHSNSNVLHGISSSGLLTCFQFAILPRKQHDNPTQEASFHLQRVFHPWLTLWTQTMSENPYISSFPNFTLFSDPLRLLFSWKNVYQTSNSREVLWYKNTVSKSSLLITSLVK